MFGLDMSIFEFFLTHLMGIFAILNPFGTLPVYIALVDDFSKKEKLEISKRTSLCVLVGLSVSFLIGKYILDFLGIQIMSLKFAGGVIIALSGFSLLRGKFKEHKGYDENVETDSLTKEDPSITPLAMPMLVGPGSISYLIHLNSQTSTLISFLACFAVIIILSLLVYLILRNSDFIIDRLGAAGLRALTRIIGFLVIAIGVEYIFGAISLFIANH